MRYNIELCYTSFKGHLGHATAGREESKDLARIRCNEIRHHAAEHIDKIRVYDQRRMKEVYVIVREEDVSGLTGNWIEWEPNSDRKIMFR